MDITLLIAPPYDDNDIFAIKLGLEKKFNAMVDLNIVEYPSLIGGFAFYADGTVYDFSIKSQLDNLLKELTSKGAHFSVQKR